MKNAKKFKGIIIFFIILSLFCFNSYVCYADGEDESTVEVEVDPGPEYDPTRDEDYSGPPRVGETSLSKTINSNESYEFTCTKTGVYRIEMTDVASNEYTSDWFIQTSSGQECRLACVAKQNNDGSVYYELINSLGGKNENTSVYVVLREGETYKVRGTGEGKKAVSVVLNQQYSNEEYKQSDYGTRLVTERDNTSTSTGSGLEPIGAGLNVPDDKTVTFKSSLRVSRTDNKFQAAFARLLIAIGDFMMKLLSDIFGDNVTVTNLIFNKVESVNPNFFKAKNVSMGIGGDQIKETVEFWYARFRGLAIALYMIVIFSIGIRVLLNSTAQGLTQARELFVEWLKGFLYLLFMPVLVYFLFEINDALIQMILDAINGTTYISGSALTDGTEFSAEAVEFRSPEYVSKYTGMMGYGTDETNNYYIKKVNDYATNFDLIRIARAYAGATQRISYVFIWYVLIGQLLTFIYIYYKRYFMTLFFIAIFPIICIFQAVGIMKDGKARAVSGWLGELISNIFTQFIHCIVYTIVTSIVVDILYDGVVNGELINWIIIIVAINFVPKGEEIVRRILRALSSGSAEGLGEHGLQKGVHALTAGAKQVFKG